MDRVRLLLLFAGLLHHLFVNAQGMYPSASFAAFDSLIYIDSDQAAIIFDTLSITEFTNVERAELSKRKAILARIQGRYSDALEYNLDALDKYGAVGDTFHIAEVYHNMGYLMRQIPDYEKSLVYFQEAIRHRESMPDSTALGQSHKEIGVIYRKLNDLVRAEYHYHKAMSLFDPQSDQRDILTLKGNFATLYSAQGKIRKALEMNMQMLPEIKANKEPESIGTRFSNIAYIYFKLKEYDKANTYIDSAIMADKAGNLLARHLRHSKLKSRILYKSKDYKAAYKERRSHTQLQDSFFRRSLAQELDNKVRIFNKEKEIFQDSLKAEAEKLMLSSQVEIEHSRRMKTFWISLLIGVILISLVMWQLYRLKLIKLQAKNDKLSSQILEQKLLNTEQENERLIHLTSLQVKFKKSILKKVNTILERNNNPGRPMRDLQRELSDQLRLEYHEEIVNQSIQDMPLVFDEFLSKKFPSLTGSERQLCFLVRNGLSIKEIANLRETSATAVQSMRYRIRKKLNLEKGEELKFFLQKIQDIKEKG